MGFEIPGGDPLSGIICIIQAEPVIRGRERVSIKGAIPARACLVELFQQFPIPVKDEDLRVREFGKAADIPVIVPAVSIGGEERAKTHYSYGLLQGPTPQDISHVKDMIAGGNTCK